jgi:hypothetical protein
VVAEAEASIGPSDFSSVEEWSDASAKTEGAIRRQASQSMQAEPT